MRVGFGETGNYFFYLILLSHIGIIAKLIIAESRVFCYYCLYMLNKDDLKAIAELIRAEGDLIRKDMATKKDLSANIGILGQILKIELAATKKEITDAMKLGFREVAKAIKGHDEQIERLEKRVGKIEKIQLS